MTYLQIINTIKDTALAQPNVNSVVREFLDLNREDAKYSAVVIQDRDGSRDRIVEQDYVTYTWHLGYVDRLTYDESNRDDIISTGINIINNIVNTIRNTWFPELEVSIVDRINTFDQRFTAQCAGVYVVLAVNAQVSDCVDSESTDLYDTYDAKITENGVYHFVPSGRPVDEINITVDVAGSGKEEVSLTDTLTMNGIHSYIPEGDTVYKDVELTVDVHPTERLTETYTTNGVKTITGEFNGGEITVDVDTDTVWGSITGNITDQTDLVDYVTGKDNEIKTWVESQSYLTSLSLNGYATESWVTNQGYITSIPDTFATKDWVSSQGYLTEHQDLSSYALKSEIPSLDGYATETWVESKGYLTEHQTLKTINGESIVGEGNIVITGGGSEEVILIPFDGDQLSMTHQELVDNVLNKIDGKPVGSYKIFFVSSDGYYYEADTINITHNVSVGGSSGGTVNDTGVYIYSNAIRLNFYLKFEDIEFFFDEFVYSSDFEYLAVQVSELESRIPDLTGYATQSWVEGKGYLTEHQSLAGYATQSWVSNQGYITSIPDTFATKDWVSSQGYLTEHQDLSSYALKSEIPSLDGYATQSWVQSQNYLTEHQDLSSYATKSWATSQFLEESKVWTGTQSAWDALTSSQKASYTIALITE